MSVFKRINVADSFVVPYTANKSWDLLSASFSDYQVTFNIGIKNTGSIFDPNSDINTNGQYDRLVYDSINTIYYPDFLPTSSETASRQGTIWNDGTLSTSSYYNGFVDLGNLDTIKFFPTGQGAIILTVNIPRQLTGDRILPTTFELNVSSGSSTGVIYDDGNYNLFYSGSNVTGSVGYILSSSMYVGNIFYEQDIAILTVIPHNILPTPTPSPTPSITPSLTPTATPSVTITPSISTTPSISPSVTPSITPTTTPNLTVSPTPTLTPTPTNTPEPSLIPIPTPSPTPSAPAPGCLVYDTLITMADGTLKPIQDVVAGDEVLSIDNIEGFILSTSTVLSTAVIFKHIVYNINNGLIKSSEDHHHIVKHNDVWEVKAANELVIGDILLGENGDEIIITNIVIEDMPQSVYNLSVNGSNTYFANGILTHNKFSLCCTSDNGATCFSITSGYNNCSLVNPTYRNCVFGDPGFFNCSS